MLDTMVWPLVNICTGIFLLALAFKPEWFGMDLKTELVTRPKHVAILKWVGAIVLLLGLSDLLARLLGFL
jgi:uncharacterized membrane protein (DUF485 family)